MNKTLKKIVGIAMSIVTAFSAIGAPASFADGGENIGKSEEMPPILIDYVEKTVPRLAASVCDKDPDEANECTITYFLKIYDENGDPTERGISFIIEDNNIIGDIVVGVDYRGLPCASGGLCEYPEINEAFRAGESVAFFGVNEGFFMYCDGNWTEIDGPEYPNKVSEAELIELEETAKSKSVEISIDYDCNGIDEGDECVYTIRLSDEYLECFRENKNAVLSFKYEEYPGRVIKDNTLSILFYFKDGRTDNCPIFMTPGMDLRGWEAISVSKILRRAGIDDPENIEKIVISQIDSDACQISMTECGIHTGPCWIRPNSNYYYVKENGKLAVRSTTIDGIRYTFDKFGVCTGKYTGWTKSSNGRKYWRNGVLVKDRQFTAPDGKKYIADAEGYVSEVLANRT